MVLAGSDFDFGSPHNFGGDGLDVVFNPASNVVHLLDENGKTLCGRETDNWDDVPIPRFVAKCENCRRVAKARQDEDLGGD
ncbi:hypothetical protein AKJ62_03715 [candidate division MSBL1 archaeon SCGC-AAA259D14]|uniref:Uncharacterized protein n=1 Tax=candidate division MSBL1 archaeon SCGC-AAA259D14 TaxID=1698261 RepID=A0A133U4L6_9EURY|nr:hypothetical protein AKJ62_03715 [candidate division MSBL1 archaeon SCGC-AAA259D14]